MVKIVGCMLTHIPAIACRSIPLISQIDHLIILLPESQVGEMKDRLKSIRHSIKKIEVVDHRIELVGGVPQMGLLRYGQQGFLQSRMRKNDIGILMDHDIKITAARAISSSRLRTHNKKEGEKKEFFKRCNVDHISHNWGHQRDALTPKQEKEFVRRDLGPVYSRPLTPRMFISRLKKLSVAAHEGGFNFFSFGYANAPHNARAQAGGYHTVATWSGLIFMFKHTPNLWDVDITICEDADIQFKIIHEKKGLGVLNDPCTVVQMELDKTKYNDGGPQHKARIRNIRTIIKRYPNVCKRAESLRCDLEHLRYTGYYGKGTKIC